MNIRRWVDGFRMLGVRMGLALLVGASVLPIALTAGVLMARFYELERIEVEKILVGRAEAISYVVDKEVRQLHTALGTLCLSKDLTVPNLARFHDYAVEVLGRTDALSILLVDPQGQFLMTTRLPFGDPLPKIAPAPLLAQTIKTQQPGVSGLFFGPVAKSLILTVSVPVIRDGVVVYTLNATISPSRIEQILIEQKLPLSWRGTVVDSTAKVIARSRDHLTFFGKEVGETTRARLGTAGSDGGSYVSRNLEGIEVLSTTYRSALTNWTVVLAVPLADLNTPLLQTTEQLIWATLVSLAFGLLLAWLIGGRIAKTITTVSEAAVRLSRGEKVSIPPVFTREGMAMRQVLIDASELADQSRHAASHDALTGMPNRVLFEFFVTQQLARCERQHSALAVLFVDLDGFKAVNDNFGHAVGDQLLIAVAQRMQLALRGSDLAARLGGDEFALALTDAEPESARVFSQRLIETISQAYLLDGIEARISASVGVACYPHTAADCASLLLAADKAMYRAKAQGKRQVCMAGD
jgi:diguanylate cyclase (GGDEF)-like protein